MRLIGPLELPVRRLARWGLGLAVPLLMASTEAQAHGVVGDRFFPATLAIDDPFVADELAVPTFALLHSSDNVRKLSLDFEYAKRITDRFAVSLAQGWHSQRRVGAGWQNLEASFKFQAFESPIHEFVLSVGVEVEWGRTGAARIGAEPETVVTPTLWWGKGAGDLPDALAWARPFAVTGLVGYAVPTRAKTLAPSLLDEAGASGPEFERHDRAVVWGGTVQYSLPYLKANVADLALPDLVNHLVPLVEFAFATPVGAPVGARRTTGTINPGVIWMGRTVQFGIEALIPLNRESGRHVGVLGQIHFYLDDLFPHSLGRPIF